MLVGSLPSNVIEHALQWVDLTAHLHLRETCKLYLDEIPRLTTTLVAQGWGPPQRCYETVFADSLIRSISVDLSRTASTSGPLGSSGFGWDSPGRHTLPLLVQHYRPSEFRVTNMVRGDEFSDTILALEENLTWLRQDLRVLQLGLATGGPRPYQDPRSHQWCMLRLRRLLGGAEAGGDVARTLAELTKSLQTTAWHAVGDSFAEEVATGMEGRTWLRLKELLLSCGIMGGDLEGLAACFGSVMPALEVLAVEGHSYRAPKTDLTAFAKALRSASTGLSHRPRLTTLSLKHFKVEGVAGLAALGAALSEDRFPRLSALSLDNCRLVDDHMRTLAAALPGMSRTLKTLSLRSNYALSAEGISALADVLQAGWVSAEPRYPRSDTSREGSDQCNDQRSDRADGAKTTAGNNTAVTGVSMYSSAAEVEAEAEAASTVPTRAPAWSVPVPVVPVSSEVSTSRLPAPAVPRPLMIESLDLSYSCWWRRPRRTMDAENSCSPLTSLLRALGEGACPRLKFLSLAGCYFGDTVVEQLVAALETGCRGLRVLDVTGNLFGKVGVRRIADSLLADKMPPQLRMTVLFSDKPPETELHAGMPSDDSTKIVNEWIDYQNLMQGSFIGPDGVTMA